jgi:hypothetical protein
MTKLNEEKLKEFHEYQQEGRAPYIEIGALEPYHLYRIHARNARIGIYLPKGYSFLIRRQKFTDWYAFEEYHWDTGAPFGTVRPLKALECTPFRQEDFQQGPWETNGIKMYGYFKHKELMLYLKTKMEEYKDE